MAENGLNHLVSHEGCETGGYDNDGFTSNHHPPEKLKSRKGSSPENGHLPANCLTNGHDRSPSLTNGSAVVVVDHGDPDSDSNDDLNVNLNVGTDKELKCPLDTKLRHYVTLDEEGKMLNSEDDLRISIPEGAVIDFNTGRVRCHQGGKGHGPLPRGCREEDDGDEEKIPMQDISSPLPQLQEDSEKALEAAQDFQNGRTSDDYGPEPAGEKQGNGGGAYDEYFIPVNTHKKYLRGEKLYLTKDSQQLCQNWRRVIVCGLIAIVIAVAVLVGVLAATGILLAESENKNSRHEPGGHSLEGIDAVNLAGAHLPRAPKVPQRGSSTEGPLSQSVSEVTPTVPAADASQSHTVVPNALVGEFTIVNEVFTPDLEDNTSLGYLSVATHLENELSRIFTDNGGKFKELKILSFRPGSIIVQFVVVWRDGQSAILAKKSRQIMEQYLAQNNNSLLAYHVDRSTMNFTDAFDVCLVGNGGCSHVCSWSYATLAKTCVCEDGQELASDGETCVPWRRTSVDFTTTQPVTTVITTPEQSLIPGSTDGPTVVEDITFLTSPNGSTVLEDNTSLTTELLSTTTEALWLTESSTAELHEVNATTSTQTTTTTESPPVTDASTLSPHDANATTPISDATEDTSSPSFSLSSTASEPETTTAQSDSTTVFSPAIYEEPTTEEITTTTSPEEETTTEAITTTMLTTTPTNNSASSEDTTTSSNTSIYVPTFVTIISEASNDSTTVQITTESTSTYPTTIELDTTEQSVATETITKSTVSATTTKIGFEDIPTTTETYLTTVSGTTTEETEFTSSPEKKELTAPTTEVVTESSTMSSGNSVTATTYFMDSTSTPTTLPPTTTESSPSTLEPPLTLLPPETTSSPTTTESTTESPEQTTASISTDTTPVATNSPTTLEDIPVAEQTSTNPANNPTTVYTTTFINSDLTTTSPSTNNSSNSTVDRTPGIRLFDNDTETMMTFFNLTSNGTEYESTMTTVFETTSYPFSTSTTVAPPETWSSDISVSTLAPTNQTTEFGAGSIDTGSATEDASTSEPLIDMNTTTTEEYTTTTISADTSTPTVVPTYTTTTANANSTNRTFNVNTTDIATMAMSITETVTVFLTTEESTLSTSFSENTTATEPYTETSATENVLMPSVDDVTTPADVTTIAEDNSTTTEPSINSTAAANITSTDEFSKLTTGDDYDLYNTTLNDTSSDVTTGISCREDQFLCSSLNQCLNNTFMCDGIEDCPDGLDENQCTETCNLNFKCSNSTMCIMNEAHCDGVWDCEDGSDEQDCTPTECAKHEVMCLDGSTCIKPGHICDWKYNCRDRSDEVGCVERTTCETGNRFFCNDGLCIPWSLKCDGAYDCKDKEDEGNCTCLEDEFRCNDGKCLKSSTRCDGHKDCLNAEDEMGCIKVDDQGLVIAYEPYSGSWSLVCAEDWSMDDAHYLCQELGFGHALSSEQHHVSFNGTWMAMRRDNLTATSLWTERVAYAESCNSNLAAAVECQAFDCGNYTGLLHRRRRRQAASPATQWPFIAYVSTFQSNKGCLSEILTPVWLVTSAECLLSIGKEPHNGSDWYVRTNVARGFDADLAQKHEVLKIIPHHHSSKFRSLILRDYDVALIRLKHALAFSETIGAICLPEEQVSSGITCFSGVLGTEKPRAPPPQSPTISSLALMVLDRDTCNQPDHYNDQINNRMLCTKSSDTTSVCDNDEGTPLMCLSGPNKWYLAGMLTYQRLCGVYNWHPAVFSNLFAMKGFIEQVIGHKQYRVHYDDSLYMITPPTTVGPTEATTVLETTVSEEAFHEVRVADQYSSMNESSSENTTVALWDIAENETELARVDDSTDVEDLLDIELSGNHTVYISTTIGNMTVEESTTGIPASDNETHEQSMALKQPRVSDYENGTSSSENETVTASSEDFAVDVVGWNSTEQNSGYFYMTNATTGVSDLTTMLPSTITPTNESSELNDSTMPPVENDIATDVISEDGSVTTTPESPTTLEPILLHSEKTEMTTTEMDNNAVTEADTTTLPTTIMDTSTTPPDMLVKDYVVRSRNIDVPLEVHVDNKAIVISEVPAHTTTTEIATTEAPSTTELPVVTTTVTANVTSQETVNATEVTPTGGVSEVSNTTSAERSSAIEEATTTPTIVPPFANNVTSSESWTSTELPSNE